MVHPTIHKIVQERMEAAQEKHRHYYAKDKILQRRRAHGVKKHDKEAEARAKEISRAVAKALHGCDNDDESESDTNNSSDDDEIDTDKLAEYIKSIPDDCSTKGDISIIVNSTGEIEKLLKHVIRAQDKILNLCGISPEWHAADTVSRFLKTTATYLEDI
ncbi:hypothetical protein BDR07DRAFT_1487914 [Suillus spraguei]|nr:hypothetical protein BDR07DRAFT_1487914 [Suillus spraguei]